MFCIDVSANVTRYSQQDNQWCGPAVVEMVRNGYPKSADRLFYLQSDLWSTIQTKNSTLSSNLTSYWDTDPHGLTGCLHVLSNPLGVDWFEVVGTQAGVLFAAIYAMKVDRYPVPILINNGQHWVALVAYQTDVEPVIGGSPTLQSVTYYDPWPVGVGAVTTLTGDQWLAGPWHYSIIYPGSWYKKFAAVIEQPVRKGTVKGTVRVNSVKRTVQKMLSPAEAVAQARRWIAELKLDERPEYSLLTRPDVDNLEPAIVRDERPGSRSKSPHFYYLIPYGFKTELNDRGSRLARVCLLLNAATGQFDEVTAFGAPVWYLTADEARAVVAAALHVDPASLNDAEVGLVFQPSGITHARAFPVWRVAVADRVLYVDQFGQLHSRLLPGMPGS